MPKPTIEADLIGRTAVATLLSVFLISIWLHSPSFAGTADTSARISIDGKDEIDEKPLWEVNLLIGGIRLPHYRGSDEYEIYALPVPYLIYRGEVFQVDREGVYSIFPFSQHLVLSLSAYANPPVPDDSDARKGMEKLDPIAELGPSLRWYFNDRSARERVYLQGSVRAAISVGLPDDLRSEYQGIHAEIACVYENRYFLRSTDWEFGVALGFDFSDADYNSYFYDVSAADAQSGRPEYKTGGGYAGFKLSGSLSKKISDRLTALFYGRWENGSGAVFEDSPLVRRDNNFSIGAGIIWNIFASERKAPKPDL